MDRRAKLLHRLYELDQVIAQVSPGSHTLREMYQQERAGLVAEIEREIAGAGQAPREEG